MLITVAALAIGFQTSNPFVRLTLLSGRLSACFPTGATIWGADGPPLIDVRNVEEPETIVKVDGDKSERNQIRVNELFQTAGSDFEGVTKKCVNRVFSEFGGALTSRAAFVNDLRV